MLQANQYYCLTIVFLLAALPLPANNMIDSLRQIIETSADKEEKIDAYREILHYAVEFSDDRMEQFADECIEYATSVGSDRGMGYAHRFLLSYYRRMGRFEEALENGEKAIPYFIKAGITTHHAMTLFSMSATYGTLGKMDKQREYCEKGVEIAESGEEDWVKAVGYGTLSNVYRYGGEPQKALEYMDKAIPIFEKRDGNHDLVVGLLGKCEILRILGRYEEIETIALRAMKLAQEHGLASVLPYSFHILQEYYTETGEYRKALDLIFKQIELAEGSGDPQDIEMAYSNAGDFHRKLGNMEEAMGHYEKALIAAQKGGIPNSVFLANFNIGVLHLKNGDVNTALYYFRDGMAIENVFDDQLADGLPAMAEAYMAIGEPDSAFWVLMKAKDLNKAASPFATNKIEIGLADYYLAKGDYQMALGLAQKAYGHAKEKGLTEQLVSVTKVLDKTYRKTGNHQRALVFSDQVKVLEDSLNNDVLKKRVTVLEMESQFEKEKELIALEQQQKEALLKAETKQTRTAAMGIAGIALLGFGFFWNARRKNKTITEQNQQLNQLNNTKDHIFSIIGHDLRKPAISFKDLSETIHYLLNRKDYTRLEKLATEMQKDTYSLYKLTDNLLSWALMQRDVMPYNPMAVAPAEVAEETVELFSRIAHNKQIELTSEVPTDLEVFADPNALSTIVRNLVDNALKYTQAGGQVTITAQPSDKGVTLQIADNGQGIPPDKLDNIFLLKKGKNEKGTAGEKGTGLGLYLINELVKLNKGAISVASQLGQGTRFEVLMPVGAVN